jgi:hypothetical protein
VWAIEGTGSFGAGLTTLLLERGEWVVEIDRPARLVRRNGAKPTSSTLFALLKKHFLATIWLRREPAEIGKPCVCCWPPATAR